MSEMVERVASRLDEIMYKPERKTEWELAPAQHHHVCRQLARAAIESMRESTKEMVDAADVGPVSDSFPADETWRLMIDAALK